MMALRVMPGFDILMASQPETKGTKNGYEKTA